MAKKTDELITVKEAVALTGYNAEWIRRLLRQGKLKGQNVAGVVWLVDRRSLIAYTQSGAAHGPQPRVDTEED